MEDAEKAMSTPRVQEIREQAAKVLDVIPEALGMRPSEWLCEEPLTCGHNCADVVDAVAQVISTLLDAQATEVQALREQIQRRDEYIEELRAPEEVDALMAEVQALREERDSIREILLDGERDDINQPTEITAENIVRLWRKAESTLAALQEAHRRLKDAAEMLWVVLANVSGGDWTKQSADWQEAAARWRDNYFAALSSPPCPECGHQHAGSEWEHVCTRVGCPCALTPPPPQEEKAHP
jgi:hypothetical protein